MDLEYKTLPFHQAKVLGDGESVNGGIAGYASQFSHVDSYGDTIQSGAYLKYLPSFLSAGFIGWNHAWDAMIGTPSDAHEDSTGLFLSAEFHSTVEAQQARTIATERLARGLSMGLSIGFQAHKWSYQDSPNNQDARIRVLEEIELFEVSLVAVPADKYAQVVAAKARDGRHATSSSLTELPYVNALARALSDVEEGRLDLSALTGFVTRSVDRGAYREKAGRVLSSSNRQMLADLHGYLTTHGAALGEQATRLADLLAATDPDPKSSEPKAGPPADLTLLRIQVESNLSRFAGLHA